MNVMEMNVMEIKVMEMNVMDKMNLELGAMLKEMEMRMRMRMMETATISLKVLGTPSCLQYKSFDKGKVLQAM